MDKKQSTFAVEELEAAIADRILTEREGMLIKLLFLKDFCTKQDLDSLTKHYDIDAANMNYSLMLAVLGFRTGWRFFPPEVVPRLKGIHRYCQAKKCYGHAMAFEQTAMLARKEYSGYAFKRIGYALLLRQSHTANHA